VVNLLSNWAEIMNEPANRYNFIRSLMLTMPPEEDDHDWVSFVIDHLAFANRLF